MIFNYPDPVWPIRALNYPEIAYEPGAVEYTSSEFSLLEDAVHLTGAKLTMSEVVPAQDLRMLPSGNLTGNAMFTSWALCRFLNKLHPRLGRQLHNLLLGKVRVTGPRSCTVLPPDSFADMYNASLSLIKREEVSVNISHTTWTRTRLVHSVGEKKVPASFKGGYSGAFEKILDVAKKLKTKFHSAVQIETAFVMRFCSEHTGELGTPGLIFSLDLSSGYIDSRSNFCFLFPEGEGLVLPINPDHRLSISSFKGYNHLLPGSSHARFNFKSINSRVADLKLRSLAGILCGDSPEQLKASMGKWLSRELHARRLPTSFTDKFSDKLYFSMCEEERAGLMRGSVYDFLRVCCRVSDLYPIVPRQHLQTAIGSTFFYHKNLQ